MSGPSNGRPTKTRPLTAVLGLAVVFSSAVLATLFLSPVAEPMRGSDDSRRADIRTYVIGYLLALMLTGAAFAIVYWPTLASATTLAVVLGLALVQMAVHFRFFLHISLGKSSREDLQLILFSALIVILMVSGTLVVLLNLRARMM
ncbi:MAG TPA: cytochrome C oxidase subunit IV family protein [Rhizomicrobium sp.]